MSTLGGMAWKIDYTDDALEGFGDRKGEVLQLRKRTCRIG